MKKWTQRWKLMVALIAIYVCICVVVWFGVTFFGITAGGSEKTIVDALLPLLIGGTFAVTIVYVTKAFQGEIDRIKKSVRELEERLDELGKQ